MYIPAAFHEQDLAELRAFLRAHPFAMMVSNLDDLPFATHLPLLLETRGETDVLIGHVARENAHHQAFDGDAESLAVFTGPHAYVSPRLMAGAAVPTWNYTAVHAYGTPEIIDGTEKVRASLVALTDAFEGGAWTLDALDGAFVEKMAAAVVVFEMPIDLWRGKYKLSQNRSENDRTSIAQGLRDEGHDDVADLMKADS